MKMLVSGAGDIKLTKDGNVLLNEMQIQSPPAALIGKCATALDDTVGMNTLLPHPFDFTMPNHDAAMLFYFVGRHIHFVSLA